MFKIYKQILIFLGATLLFTACSVKEAKLIEPTQIKTSDIELVQLLIDSGANVDVKDSKKRTPSVLASQLKEDVIYRLLKEASNENLGGKVKMKKNINIDN